MSCFMISKLAFVFCFILLLFSSNVERANAHLIPSKKHHNKIAYMLKDDINGGGRRMVLGEVETREEIVVMDYDQPHRKPPIHNEKS
ncbi:unnamed protein product [Cochlearia groenlandica]